MLKKIVYAGAQSASFVQATKDLAALAEVSLSRERVQRWTKRVGQQRTAEVQALAVAYQALPLPEQYRSPTEPIPPVACVQMDGGRIQVRKRRPAAKRKEEGSSGHWRETLVGCLLSMSSQEQEEDPCPTIPSSFVDPARMADLSREIKDFSAQAREDYPDAQEQEPVPRRPGQPALRVRSVVASREGVEAFGPRLAAAAHARGFHAAVRKAFVADGSATNWGVHQKHFSHYTPILDFTHAICYVYAAAMAGRSRADGWQVYCQWAQWLWQGDVGSLIAALQARAGELGPPRPDAPEMCPSRIVAETLRYVQNQRARMNYGHYRRQGLPITSSHIESTIKQVNRRVKGTEKFWDQGAQPLLQLVADHLSETADLARFWKQRPLRLRQTRCYHVAA